MRASIDSRSKEIGGAIVKYLPYEEVWEHGDNWCSNSLCRHTLEATSFMPAGCTIKTAYLWEYGAKPRYYSQIARRDGDGMPQTE